MRNEKTAPLEPVSRGIAAPASRFTFGYVRHLNFFKDSNHEVDDGHWLPRIADRLGQDQALVCRAY